MLALAGNLAHPTGNVTGVTLQGLGQDEKCLQLLKELVPRASRIGVLLNPDNPAWADYLEMLNPAAGRLGLVLVRVASRGLADIDQTLAGLDGEKLDALLQLNDSTFEGLVGGRIIGFARERHLPSASTAFNFAQSGGLLALGADQECCGSDQRNMCIEFLEGVRPGDLPVERPSKVRLSINLITTAKGDWRNGTARDRRPAPTRGDRVRSHRNTIGRTGRIRLPPNPG